MPAGNTYKGNYSAISFLSLLSWGQLLQERITSLVAVSFFLKEASVWKNCGTTSFWKDCGRTSFWKCSLPTEAKRTSNKLFPFKKWLYLNTDKCHGAAARFITLSQLHAATRNSFFFCCNNMQYFRSVT